MSEMAALRQQMAAKDERFLELATKRPESSGAEALLGEMVKGDNARLLSFRQQVDSELRMKNEMHKAEMDRLHARFEDIARRQEEAHTRELSMARQTYENGQALLKVSYEGQLEGLKREITHLAGQLHVSQAEVVALREKKDKSTLDQLTELAAMKEAMAAFTGSDAKEEGGTIERIVSTLAGSSLAEGVAARLAGPPPEMAAALPPAGAVAPNEIPFDKPVQLPDGRVVVRRADGTLVEIKTKNKAAAPTREEGVTISDEDVAMAIQFMESALSSDTDPSDFARTARSVLSSGQIRAYLGAQGVDAFLDRVAKLKPGSPLLHQHGKNWTRKVAAALLE